VPSGSSKPLRHSASTLKNSHEGPFDNNRLSRMLSKHHEPLILRGLCSQKGEASGVISEKQGRLDHIKPSLFRQRPIGQPSDERMFKNPVINIAIEPQAIP
jgi:hypothetical protein